MTIFQNWQQLLLLGFFGLVLFSIGAHTPKAIDHLISVAESRAPITGYTLADEYSRADFNYYPPEWRESQ